MGLYRNSTVEGSNYNIISKNIGEVYQPTPNNIIRSTSSEPIIFDMDFFNLSSSEPVVKLTEPFDEKKIVEQKNIFFNKYFGL